MIYFKETGFKQIIISFMMVSACITAAMGIMGIFFLPDMKVGYDNFFTPFLFAALSMLPSAVYYSRKVLSRRQMLFRMMLHLLLLEVTILTFAYLMGTLASREITVALAVSVMVIDVVVTLLMKVNDKRVAIEFNTALKQMQETGTTE